MDLLLKKNEYIKSIFKFYKRIENRINYIYKHTGDPILSLLINKSIEIEKSYKELNDLYEKNEINPMRISHLIGICDGNFSKIIKEITQINLLEAMKASKTYIMETITEFNEFENTVSEYMRDPLNDNLISFLMDKIKEEDPSKVEQSYNDNIHSTILYAKYLQHHIDTNDKNGIYYEMLERAKTNILNVKKIVPIKPSKKMMPLQRFGLLPVKQSLSIIKLIETYMGLGCYDVTKNTTSIEDFINCASTINVNVLVIKNITSYPVEFNLWKLINKTDAEGYTFKWDAGINEKILKRYSTISEMENMDTPDHEMGYEATPHVRKIGAPWFIVRTLNGKVWDAMSNKCGLTAPSTYSFLPESLYIDNDLAQKILRGPSARIDVYNENKNSSFLKCIESTKDVASEIKLENVGLINTLIHRITNKIIEYVDKALVPLPTSPKEIELAIMDNMFIEIANVEMLKSYAECGINNRLPVDELVGTFISDVDSTIVTQLSRNLKYNIIEFGPPAKLFKEYSGAILSTKIYNIFVDIIKKSVSATIRSKENIYEKLLIKNNLIRVLI